MIKWGRSKEGYIDSKCGRFSIQPFFWGHCSPQAFEIYDNKNKRKVSSARDTQKECKAEVDFFMINEVNVCCCGNDFISCTCSCDECSFSMDFCECE